MPGHEHLVEVCTCHSITRPPGHILSPRRSTPPQRTPFSVLLYQSLQGALLPLFIPHLFQRRGPRDQALSPRPGAASQWLLLLGSFWETALAICRRWGEEGEWSGDVGGCCASRESIGSRCSCKENTIGHLHNGSSIIYIGTSCKEYFIGGGL